MDDEKYFVTDETIRDSLQEKYPWAEIIRRVDGGWMLFRNRDALQRWENQV